MALLALSASVPGMRPRCSAEDNCNPTDKQSEMDFLALYLIALGTGGIKPCVSSFGADQFDDTDEKEKKQKSSFFNWFYLSINIGALIAASVLVCVQDNVSWGWGFGIPAIAMAIAVCLFLFGYSFVPKPKAWRQPSHTLVSVRWALYLCCKNHCPVTRKFTGHKNGLSQLQRIGVGLFISIFPMVIAAVLEHERLQMIKRHNYYELKEMPMTIFWQVPQYFLIGCAEVLTFIGQLEFFYEQAPNVIRSFCSALSLTTGALGSYLSDYIKGQWGLSVE
ncbi:hypothetical protein V6N13_002028 [Hibiscus sabdariffa]